jgi:hypothetical protein
MVLLAGVSMVAKKQESRSSIIDAVKTPLGFFALAILITEAVLLALSPQARGFDFTLLVMGAVAGFALILIMVFVLILMPKAREILVGQTPASIARQLQELQLSSNDIVFMMSIGSIGISPPQVAEQPDRVTRFQKIGLVEKRRKDYFDLTADGRELQSFVFQVQSASRRE